MIYRWSSSKEVVSKVYRDLKLQEEDRWMDMIEWIGEAIGFIKLPYYLKPVIDLNVQVVDFKAPIPCDLVELLGISYCGAPLPYGSGIFDYKNQTDTDKNYMETESPMYVLNPGYINTNFKTGTLKLSYKAIPTDEDGFPLIADLVSFKEACYRYIVWKLYYPRYLTGQIKESVYSDMERQWVWYCGQAGAEGMIPNLDQMEAIRRAVTSLVPNVNKYSSYFRDIPMGSKSQYNNF
jgi:hypothetical protein